MKVKINSQVWYKNKPLSVGDIIEADENHLQFFIARGDTVIQPKEVEIEIKPQPTYETKVIIPNKKGKKK